MVSEKTPENIRFKQQINEVVQDADENYKLVREIRCTRGGQKVMHHILSLS